MGTLQIGNRTVDRGAATAYARRYLTEGGGWAYPSYDGYDAKHARGPLVDADFLAPVLLNVSHMRVRTYEELQGKRTELQSVLDEIPTDLDLREAGEDDLRRLGELFSVLDGEGIHGAKGTVLAKVLHRKRPAFVPLYDSRVYGVYVGGDPAPVPTPTGHRSWQEFMPLFAEAVRADLDREWDLWTDIASHVEEPPVTQLRALDIVAWWAGAGTPATPAPEAGLEDV